MKKALFILLAVVLTVSLAACVAAPAGQMGNTTAAPTQNPAPDPEQATAPVQEQEATQAQKANEEPKPTEAPNTAKQPAKTEGITKADAKSIALKHAGLTADKIRDYDIEKDMEGGVLYYEIDFESGGYEYDYLIRVEDGKILRNEKEPEFD